MPEQDPIPDSTIPPVSHAEDTPMLDVHPAHHAASTWREFFTHIATIVLGLLIAVGLEQTVEYFHHRRLVAETREAFRIERQTNREHFFVQTQEFRRFLPILQTNLAVFQYLKKHPAAPPEQWPGKLDWYHLTPIYFDSAWRTAQQNNVLEFMPDREVGHTAFLYLRLAHLSDSLAAESEAVRDAAAFSIQDPDPTHLSPTQIDREIDLTTQALLKFSTSALGQRNLTRNFPDFPPATTVEDESRIWHTSPTPEYNKAFDEMIHQAELYERDHQPSKSQLGDAPPK